MSKKRKPLWMRATDAACKRYPVPLDMKPRIAYFDGIRAGYRMAQRDGRKRHE